MFLILEELVKIIKKRKLHSINEKSYTYGLLKNKELCFKKFREEALELLDAAKYKNKKCVIHESADLLYHFFVLLELKKVSVNSIMKELKRRKKISGIQEKKNRKKNVR
jgi:phosphoribosyl-ATP pyrophosphohydrolase